MTLLAIFVAMTIGLTVILVFVGLWHLMPQDEVGHRIHEMMRTEAVDKAGGGKMGSTMMTQKALERINKSLLTQELGQGINDSLLQANLKITAIEYILIVIGVTLSGAALGYMISGHPVSILIAAIICFFLPPSFIKFRQAKRRRLFAEQLPDSLIQLSGSLRAGYSLLQSLDVVQKQMPWPTSEEMARVVREVQLGQPLNTALLNLSRRITSEDMVMVISSINIHQQVGGNLAEVLDTVAETLRERRRIKREVEVLTAQQRISAYVLVAMPIALGGVLLIINPEYEMRLFTPGITLCIPCGAGLSMIAGFFIMRRIIDIDI